MIIIYIFVLDLTVSMTQSSLKAMCHIYILPRVVLFGILWYPDQNTSKFERTLMTMSAVCYLSVCRSRAPSLVQLILGGGKPSTGQRMVSDWVVLVRWVLCPMLMLMFFWKASGWVCCCLLITGLFAYVSNEERSDQLGILSVKQIRYKHNIKLIPYLRPR